MNIKEESLTVGETWLGAAAMPLILVTKRVSIVKLDLQASVKVIHDILSETVRGSHI